MPVIKGSDLTKDQQRDAFATCTSRLSLEYGARQAVCPQCRDFWSRCLGQCRPADQWSKTDADWLASHVFRLSRSGRIVGVYQEVDAGMGVVETKPKGSKHGIE